MIFPSLASSRHDTGTQQIAKGRGTMMTNVEVLSLAGEHGHAIRGVSSEKELIVENLGTDGVDVRAQTFERFMDELDTSIFFGSLDTVLESLDTKEASAFEGRRRETSSFSRLLSLDSPTDEELDSFKDNQG